MIYSIFDKIKKKKHKCEKFECIPFNFMYRFDVTMVMAPDSGEKITVKYATLNAKIFIIGFVESIFVISLR